MRYPLFDWVIRRPDFYSPSGKELNDAGFAAPRAFGVSSTEAGFGLIVRGMPIVDNLHRLAARASTLDERLGGNYLPDDAGAAKHRNKAERRLAAWKGSGGGGDAEWPVRRLARAGIDESLALALLGKVELRRGDPLPAWAKIIGWAASAIKQGGGAALESGTADPLPFEELLWPAVCAAHRRLARRLTGKLPELLSTAARADLRRSLLSALSRASAAALFAEFQLFRHLYRAPAGRSSAPAGSAEPRAIYEAFLIDLRTRWDEFLCEKPVLARIIGTIVDQWLEAVGEFAERLARDFPALAEWLAAGGALGRVTAVETDLSDPHRGGRKVIALTFAAGQKVVYKPKDLRVDAAWRNLLAWLDAREAPISLKAPRVLTRGDYGWAEFIAADPRDPTVDAPVSDRRAGGLLALLYLLQAKDMHGENVIFNDGGPVLVDLETLLHPDFSEPLLRRPADAATRTALKQLADSVLATLYLPSWVLRPDGRAIAVGGIGGRAPAPPKAGFQHINADAMRQVRAGEKEPDAVPDHGLKGSRPGLDIAAVTDGFAEMYSFLAARRRDLVAPSGPVEAFRGLRVRAVVAATPTYDAVAKRAARPDNLDAGADWSLHFEALGRDLRRNLEADASWHVLAAERRALADLDMPFFSAATDAKWIEAGDGERIEDYLAAAPIDTVLRRIEQLGEEGLEKQLCLIRAALALARPDANPPGGDGAFDRPAVSPVAGKGADTDQGERFAAMARHLGVTVNRAAIVDKQGAAWIGIAPVDHDHAAVTAVGAELYAGTIGIALFLAALARVVDDQGSRDLALRAVASACRIHGSSHAGSARRIDIGGGMGTGSVVYGLVRIAGFLAEPALLQEAARMSLLLTEDRIPADRVFHDAASAILGLLALHDATGDVTVLERAAWCGRHLLANQAVDGAGNKEWRTRRGGAAPLAGLAHGTAGIALSLARLHGATGEAVFRQAAEDAMRSERAAFVSGGEGPGSHPRSANGPAGTTCRWCDGMSGMGLARLGVSAVFETPDLLAEIDVAVDAAMTSPLSPHDHLCCGNFGRIEFLLTVGQRLGRDDLVRHARRAAAGLVTWSIGRGGFALEGNENDLHLGFFRGLSGIGYELLRLADPVTLPSVLLWE